MMPTLSFSAQVAEWARKVEGALDAVFKEACQSLVTEMDQLLVSMVYDRPVSPSGYKRTGFLRASLMASKDAMPTLSRANPGAPVPADFGDVILVIQSLDIGETLYLGMTANYAGFVHFGANGNPPRPWIQLAAQRWPQLVDEAAARVKQALGL